MTEQEGAAKKIAPKEAFVVREGDSEYVVTPSDALDVSATIDFEHALIGRQFASFRVTPESFASEIAPARTFGFTHEVEALRARGLARGGTPQQLQERLVADIRRWSDVIAQARIPRQ